jgi:uncharacterized protein
MFIRDIEEQVKINETVFEEYKMGEMAYFDIETTGFDKEENNIILLSMGYFKDKGIFNIKQLFCEDIEEESELLTHFKEHVAGFDKWCSYNGLAFDEPFIKQRMESNGLSFIPPREHVDLYRIIRPYYKKLGMERCNLKSVEKHVGIERQDRIDGGMSVELYYEFLKTKDKNIRQTILLHNYEDVLHLPLIFGLVDQVKQNTELIREDCLTEKQLKFLKLLLKKHSIDLDIDVERISKKSASRVIDSLLKGNTDCIELLDIINRNS